jgi:hypothetical protein
MQLFDTIDEDRSGEIDKGEYEAAVAKMDEGDLRNYAGLAFGYIDQDGSGTISRNEFRAAIGTLAQADLERLHAGLSRNELSYTSETDTVGEEGETSFGSVVATRFKNTAEVIVSKIFPAGFGWQGASVLADNAGFTSDSLAFAASTGLGDGVGVAIGHYSWCALMKAAGRETDMTAQAHTSILLGSAAVCSGTLWQPWVTFLHDTAGLGFTEVALGTVGGCTLAFYVGLRMGRVIYSNFLSEVQEPTYQNLKADAWLSLAVGGATGAFVGTDCSFVNPSTGVDTNWLRGAVGIEDGTSDLLGMTTAGVSTGLGFGVFQTVQNVALPAGKNWCD